MIITDKKRFRFSKGEDKSVKFLYCSFKINIRITIFLNNTLNSKNVTSKYYQEHEIKIRRKSFLLEVYYKE